MRSVVDGIFCTMFWWNITAIEQSPYQKEKKTGYPNKKDGVYNTRVYHSTTVEQEHEEIDDNVS